MPMLLQREETGVEFDVSDGRDTVEELAGKKMNPSLDRVANFRWSGDEREMLCALCAAAALAKLTGGLVFEEMDGRVMPFEEAARFAAQHVRDVLKSAIKVRGTRPADFKHYLRPLLKERSDLVLIGHMLLIRPVRHIMRGALFVPCLNKQSCYVARFAAPLYDGHEVGEPLTGRIHSHLWDVWQPHFVPLLMDVLAEDVFSDLGSLTTLSDLAERGSCPTAYILAGERDKAAELIRKLEPQHVMNAERRLLTRDDGDICRRFREREEVTAKALKLGDVWQPAPFPLELPASERHRAAEPLFTPRPWLATPATLLEEAPVEPGALRFSKEQMDRNGRVLLVVPIGRKEAEQRDREDEPYVLATRLATGSLMTVRWIGGHDRNEPNTDRLPLDPIIQLYSRSHRIHAVARTDSDRPDLRSFTSFSVSPRGDSFREWSCPSPTGTAGSSFTIVADRRASL